MSNIMHSNLSPSNSSSQLWSRSIFPLQPHSTMASNRSKAAAPKVAAPKAISQGGTEEKEEDMFVLISRRNPWKDGKLVSSLENPPTASTKSADKGSSAKDKDGWETVPLFGGNPSQFSEK
ncbi:hypothetical protein GGR58DRAFT_506612 [Xylaria digitata]|nr:hypothetical protein GGR58DRAFT_506612 [Xylaria digitata]